MKSIKFFIGPMTQNVIDSTIEFAEENNINFGFILTRRQIDWNGGYVGYNTQDFIKYVRSRTDKILICRDHAGLYQGELSKITGVVPTKYEDLYSMIQDAREGVDIIHIDPWKKYPKFEQYELGLNETINNIILINKINKQIKFEIGTEEAIKPDKDNDLFRLLGDLEFELGPIFNNIKYAVIQSGTKLEETKNTGKFNLERLQHMIKVCRDFNLLTKEHNGDYLTNDEIKIRFDNGLDAINIAPEFGVIETKVLIDHINNKKDLKKIYDICLQSGDWKKWVDLSSFDPSKEKNNLIKICGHYHNKEIKNIVNIDDDIIKNIIKIELNKLII